MSTKAKQQPDASAPSSQQVTALIQKLAAAEKTFTALGANVDPDKHVALLQQAQNFLRQVGAAQQQAEELRRKTESRLQAVWENSVDGMRLTDENGMIIAVNQAFCRIVGMKREDLEGLLFTVTYSDRENLEKILQKYQQRFKERSFKKLIERNLIFRSGKAVTLEVANSFVEIPGERPLLLGLFRDITEKQRLAAQLNQTQKMDSIGRLAGCVAHEYNEILTAIQGNVSVLQSPRITPLQLSDAARHISAAADRAAHLNRRLMTFSRRQVINPRTIDLNDVARQSTQMLQKILGENIGLQMNCAPSLPYTDADPEMIEQVLTNLTVNARDAMPNGGSLSVSTRLEQIDETYVQRHLESRTGSFLKLQVTDTGRGISPEDIPYIFEPFFTSKEPSEGHGLSLAIVYGIIKQHNGWITARSELERGTTFEIFLPVSEKKIKSPEPKPADKKPKAMSETILVAEDEPLLLELTKHFLESHGYKVFTAASGVEAISVWDANKEKIDLLFTDIVMPGGINGRQLAEKLQEDRHNLKVVYTSGYSAGILGKNFVLQEGINFLQKPYHRRQLVKMIRDALDSK